MPIPRELYITQPGVPLTDRQREAKSFAYACWGRIEKACPLMMDRIYGSEFGAICDAIYDEFMERKKSQPQLTTICANAHRHKDCRDRWCECKCHKTKSEIIQGSNV